MSANTKTFRYYIDLDERGEFYADVRDERDQTIFEIKDFEIFEEGWMRNKHDLHGLGNYLVDLGLMKQGDLLIEGGSTK